jgi:hypothetical protein
MTTVSTIPVHPMSAAQYAVLPNLIQQYIDWTGSTAVYPKDVEAEYLQLGLLSEAGEVAALFKRRLRDGAEIDRTDELHELGDCAWYLARMVPAALVWANAIEKIGEYVNQYRFDYLLTVLACDRNIYRQIAAFAALCLMRGFRPLEVLAANQEKLNGRLDRGTIHGKGGER